MAKNILMARQLFVPSNFVIVLIEILDYQCSTAWASERRKQQRKTNEEMDGHC